MINIKELIPFMRKGWVAMDKCGTWCWFSSKPICHKKKENWCMPSYGLPTMEFLGCFDISPAEDWTKSLIKVENK